MRIKPGTVQIATVVLLAAAATVLTLSRHTSSQVNHARPTATTTAAPPAPPIPASALASLLLPADQIAHLVGVPTMTVTGSANTLLDDSALLVQKDCLGAFMPAQHPVYNQTGWTAARTQTLREPGDLQAAYEAVQAVVGFPNADAANKLFAQQKTQWTHCAGQVFTVQPPDPANTSNWTFGALTVDHSTLVITETREAGNDWGCQRALAVRNNIAIDVTACLLKPDSQGVDILNTLAAKVSQ